MQNYFIVAGLGCGWLYADFFAKIRYYMEGAVRKRWTLRPQVVIGAATCGLLWLGLSTTGLSIAAVLRPASQSGPLQTIAVSPRHTPQPTAPVDCAARPCMALTFDDGPNPVTTSQILDILEREQVRATFFVVGARVPGQEPILRRMYASGHEIGNHSWSHPDMTMLSTTQMLEQVNQTQAVISAAGVPAPTLFRPPYGAVDVRVRNTVPMTLALWNIDPLDWQTKDAYHVHEIIVYHAKPGAVVDMHDIYPVTVESLTPTIQALRPYYQFVTFSELMQLGGGQPGEYYGR